MTCTSPPGSPSAQTPGLESAGLRGTVVAVCPKLSHEERQERLDEAARNLVLRTRQLGLSVNDAHAAPAAAAP